jgi:dTDP-4-dehydrorhamnose 3,5-epimerase
MRFLPLTIPDVIVIEADVAEDDRGFFLETYRKRRFEAAGITSPFVQDNHSGSKRGVLRGLHYQIHRPQGKLVRAIVGEVFDVAVDLRRESPSFGRYVDYALSAEKKNQIWIPPGFAHGFYVVSDWAEVLYKTTDDYTPEWERTLLWNDPAVDIPWPLVNGHVPILSKKDSKGKMLDEAETFDLKTLWI